MADVMPADIHVQERGDVVRYQLPKRQIGAFRWIGLAPLVFGLGFAGFALQWMLLTAGDGRGWVNWVFVCFGVPFLVIGLLAMGVGLLILDSRSEIELSRGRLRAIDTNGWLRWPRKREVAQIRRFIVAGPGKDGESITGPLSNLAAIRVEGDTPKAGMLMAVAYPRESLRWLADDLARRCQVESQVLTGLEPRKVIEVIEKNDLLGKVIEVIEKNDLLGDAVVPDRVEQPVESDAVITEQADGMTVTIPAPGLRGQKGLFVFGCIWTAFVLMIAIPLVTQTIQRPRNNDWIGVAVTVGIFLPVGIALVVGGLNVAYRSTVLTISADRLQIVETGLFGTKEHGWRRREIADVRMDVYMTDDDSKPSHELQIHTNDGKHHGFLRQRSDDELAWLATRLRQTLALKPRKAGDPLPFVETLTQPLESDVVREDRSDGVTLTVPPAGIGRGSKGLFAFSLVWCGFMAVFDGMLLLFARGGIGFMMLPFLAVSLLFWAIGIAMLLGAVNMGRRQAVFAVVGDKLLAMQTGIFGPTRHEWDKDEIVDVRPGPSGMKVNNHAVLELHIVQRHGKPVGFLSGRDTQELAWLATVLRKSLGVPREEAAAAPDEQPLAINP